MAIKINHVAVVSADFDTALHFWRDVIGLELGETENNQVEAVAVAFLHAENSVIELISPTTPDSGVAKYLDKRGAGMHHLCLEVEDIDATLDHLRSSGVEMINHTPRTRENGVRYAFTHPKSTGGVMIEFYEKPEGS